MGSIKAFLVKFVAVFLGRGELSRSCWGNSVFEEPTRHRCTHPAPNCDLASGVGSCHDRFVVHKVDQLVAGVLVDLFVHFDELAVRQADNATTFATVQNDFAIFALKRKAESCG